MGVPARIGIGVASAATALWICLMLSASTANAQSCFADCNGDGKVVANDLAKVNADILKCAPCPNPTPGGPLIQGGIATGCAAVSGGCPAADFNRDGCLTVTELARQNHNALSLTNGCGPPPTPVGGGTPSPTPGTVFTIGSTSGSKGSQVTVGISLTKNATMPVTIGPLIFDFNPAVLTFGGCTSTVVGKAAFWGIPSSGVGSVVDIDDVIGENGNPPATPPASLTVFPDGQILSCTFTIAAGAASGASTLTFVSADLSDAEFNDSQGQGINGSITVQ